MHTVCHRYPNHFQAIAAAVPGSHFTDRSISTCKQTHTALERLHGCAERANNGTFTDRTTLCQVQCQNPTGMCVLQQTQWQTKPSLCTVLRILCVSTRWRSAHQTRISHKRDTMLLACLSQMCPTNSVNHLLVMTGPQKMKKALLTLASFDLTTSRATI